jgi:predicted esterase
MIRMGFKQLRLLYNALAMIIIFSSSCSSPPSAVTPPTTFPPDPTPAVSVTKDVIYASSLEDDGSDWTLDVYTPIKPGGGPIVVLLHGLGANKEGYSRESEIIAENGATVYTVNWPIVAVDVATFDNGRGFREISETLNCAIFFALENELDLGGDSENVILVAHSYGALYGAWIALASNQIDAQWEEFHADRNGPRVQVECISSSVSAHVDGFIGIGGGRYSAAEVLRERDAELWEIVSPYAYFGQNSGMSILLLHGKQDTLAKPESSQNFNDILLEAGYESRVILFDGRHIVPPQLTFEAVIELTNE